jgi:hypothetical protein
MLKFRDVLSRWERRELSMMEAGELLGMSERQFRRYRDRFEDEGETGLIDRRLGKPSEKRIEAAAVGALAGMASRDRIHQVPCHLSMRTIGWRHGKEQSEEG